WFWAEASRPLRPGNRPPRSGVSPDGRLPRGLPHVRLAPGRLLRVVPGHSEMTTSGPWGVWGARSPAGDGPPIENGVSVADHSEMTTSGHRKSGLIPIDWPKRP